MKLKITVHGVAYEVDVEVLEANDEMIGSRSPLPAPTRMSPSASAAPSAAGAAPVPSSSAPLASTGDSTGVSSPIAGTVLQVKVKPGDTVTAGQPLLVIEAMKMETAISAPQAGTVRTVLVAAGDSVRETQPLIEFD